MAKRKIATGPARGTGFAFTTREDTIVLRCIRKYPLNIRYGLTEAHRLLSHRTFSSIQARYYGTKTRKGLKHDPSVFTVSTGSKAGFSKNVKNQHKDKKTGILGKQKLNPSLLVVQHYTNVEPKAKAALLAFLATI